MIARTWRRWAGAVVALWAVAGLAHAQAATEATVKAAFLYKFAGYIEWPPSALPLPSSPIVYGVVGADDVAAELESLAQRRTVENRQVTVRRLREGDSPRGVHVLFVGRSEAGPRAITRAAQMGGGTLVVADSPGALELGASINFLMVENRVGFEVSVDSADRSGVRISSRMLAVARRVVPRS